ncbi:MAG: PHP domain-containing protein, partial [Lachnospiraceae bacterium]|nr:PHP domain-containing protein [Lachnospiraceae bacterium]
MSKSFTEVFPTLEMTREESAMFSGTEILRVSTSRRQDFLHIYLLSRRLIDKKDVNRIERKIKTQLFSDVDLTVRIFERFELSSQYTPETFLENYIESLYSELKSFHPMIYALVKNGEFSFPSEHEVTLTMEESIVAEDHADEITGILDKVFHDRGGFDVQIAIDYVPRRDRKKKNDPAEHLFDRKTIDLSPVAQRDGGPAETDEPAEEPAEKPAGKAAGKAGRSGAGEKNAGKLSHSDDPNVLMGRDFDDDATAIPDIEGESGVVCLRGKILAPDLSKPKELRIFDLKKGDKKLVIFDLTDFQDTIRCKIFVTPEQWETVSGKLKVGAFVKLKGIPILDAYDHELTMQSINAIKLIPDFREKRKDDAEVKRVELHCHTKMSEMDGVSDVKAIVGSAYEWGMPGIAITDHGVVQALTDANHAWESLFDKANGKRKDAGEPPIDRQDFFKVILGVEAYLVDDLKPVVQKGKSQILRDSTFVVFDLETTGFSPVRDRIIEIGAVKVKDGEIVDRFSVFVNPKKPIPPRIEEVTNINDDMVKDAETIETILPEFVKFIGDAVLVGHNVAFDIGFINQNCREQGIAADYTTIDTMGLSRHYFPLQSNHKLDTLAKTLEVPLDGHHRAVNDAECTAGIFLKFLPYFERDGIRDMDDLADRTVLSTEMIRNLRPHHAIILAKNTIGRVNLYRLISKSHVEYYKRFPLIPKSEVEKHREGLILGSACCAGELYEALVEGRSEEEISRLVKYYDYLEIQPVANNHFMVDAMTKRKDGPEEKRYPNITSDDDIREINREVIRLGDLFHKPVVATCDVHFLDPEDEIYRTMILSGKNMDDEDPAPLYLRTTEEMLAEFDYLDPERAREIVIDNPRRILSMCDSISPVRPDKCAPV